MDNEIRGENGTTFFNKRRTPPWDKARMQKAVEAGYQSLHD